MEFLAGNKDSFSLPSRLPKRLRRRFLGAECKSPSTVEDIEAKLRNAQLRRQKYYEKFSSEARAKPIGPSRRSSRAEYLGQRLEAKLHAAEQKRLSILAKAQMRLARKDELRQAAKSVCHQQEIQRRKKKDELEDRLQKAKRQRAEYLRQRGRLLGYGRENWNEISKQDKKI